MYNMYKGHMTSLRLTQACTCMYKKIEIHKEVISNSYLKIIGYIFLIDVMNFCLTIENFFLIVVVSRYVELLSFSGA